MHIPMTKTQDREPLLKQTLDEMKDKNQCLCVHNCAHLCPFTQFNSECICKKFRHLKSNKKNSLLPQYTACLQIAKSGVLINSPNSKRHIHCKRN